jgi:AcrR family transcriptional regulator
MAAVLDAAARMFGERGPRAVTIRDIAAAARVNHALVHRYVGSKQQVLRMVLERSAAAMAASIEDSRNSSAAIEKAFEALLGNPSYWRALARAMLDGEQPHQLQRNFPTVQRLIALLRKEPQDKPQNRSPSSSRTSSAELAVATAGALMMGWVLFEPLLLASAELGLHHRQDLRDSVKNWLKAIIEGSASEPTTLADVNAKAAWRRPLNDRFRVRQSSISSSGDGAMAALQTPK